jgi:hypothetical protein
MKRRLLIALAVLLLLVAGLGAVFVLANLQPRYDESMSLVDYHTAAAQDAVNRGDAATADSRTSMAASNLEDATERGNAITITWVIVGVAVLGAVGSVLGARRPRPAPSASTPAPPSPPVGIPSDALAGPTAATTAMPAMSGPQAAPPPPRGPHQSPPPMPPGWYRDAQGAQRWFDGRSWTPYVR